MGGREVASKPAALATTRFRVKSSVLSLEIKGVEIGRKKNRRRQFQTNCLQDQHLVINVAPEDADRTNIAFIYFLIFALKLES